MSVRYAIRFDGGMYADKSFEPAPLEKARLWTNVGHVKNHLHAVYGGSASLRRSYPAGTRVVQLVATYVETTMWDVNEVMDQHAAEERDASLDREREREVNELREARETLARLEQRAKSRS